MSASEPRDRIRISASGRIGVVAPSRGRWRYANRLIGGQASVEYLVAVALLAVALIVGEPSPLAQLMAAIGEHYQRFTYAISLP